MTSLKRWSCLSVKAVLKTTQNNRVQIGWSRAYPDPYSLCPLLPTIPLSTPPWPTSTSVRPLGAPPWPQIIPPWLPQRWSLWSPLAPSPHHSHHHHIRGCEAVEAVEPTLSSPFQSPSCACAAATVGGHPRHHGRISSTDPPADLLLRWPLPPSVPQFLAASSPVSYFP
jgi:hypothetical protein